MLSRHLARKNVTKTASLFSGILLAIALTGCGGDDKETKKIEESAKVAPEDTSIILSSDGVGPINATTSFNMHQMTLAFNNYSVVEEVNYVKGQPFSAIRVSEGVNTIMNIIPDASRQGVYSVMIEDNIIKNSLGHPLGSIYSEVYTYGQQQQCQAGSADLAGKMLCYAPQNHNILYVFNGQWAGAGNGKVPPADILQGWALETIIWRPKS